MTVQVSEVSDIPFVIKMLLTIIIIRPGMIITYLLARVPSIENQ